MEKRVKILWTGAASVRQIYESNGKSCTIYIDPYTSKTLFTNPPYDPKLEKMFNNPKIEDIAVLISHHHIDHVNGTLPLLKANPKAKVYGERESIATLEKKLPKEYHKNLYEFINGKTIKPFKDFPEVAITGLNSTHIVPDFLTFSKIIFRGAFTKKGRMARKSLVPLSRIFNEFPFCNTLSYVTRFENIKIQQISSMGTTEEELEEIVVHNTQNGGPPNLLLLAAQGHKNITKIFTDITHKIFPEYVTAIHHNQSDYPATTETDLIPIKERVERECKRTNFIELFYGRELIVEAKN